MVVAGDDQTDESMFRLDVKNLLTIRVGDGDTHARYQVPTPAAFRRLLENALENTKPRVSADERR